jgi:predicted Zn-dependent peptidase
METNIYKVTELLNGLKVVVDMRNISNIAGVCIKYHTGSLSDPDDKRGLTHLVEHMIMQLPLPERNALIGGLHGQTAEHFVSIWGDCLLENFSKYTRSILKQVYSGKYTEYQLSREKQVTLQEFAEYQHNKLSYFIYEARKAVFKDYPIDPVLGSPETINNISLVDIINWQRRIQSSNNTVIYITGNLSDDQLRSVMKLVKSVLGQQSGLRAPQETSLAYFNKDEKGITGESTRGLTYVSVILQLPNVSDKHEKIILYSLLLCALTQYDPTKLTRLLRGKFRHIYDIHVMPIITKNWYLQIVTTTSNATAVKTGTYIKEYFTKLVGSLNSESIHHMFELIKLQNQLMFDGVGNSIRSFSRVLPIQEDMLFVGNALRPDHQKIINFISSVSVLAKQAVIFLDN